MAGLSERDHNIWKHFTSPGYLKERPTYPIGILEKIWAVSAWFPIVQCGAVGEDYYSKL